MEDSDSDVLIEENVDNYENNAEENNESCEDVNEENDEAENSGSDGKHNDSSEMEYSTDYSSDNDESVDSDESDSSEIEDVQGSSKKNKSDQSNLNQGIDENMESAIQPENDSIKQVITLTDIPSCIRFSPKTNVIAVGNTGGDTEIFSFSGSHIEKLTRVECFYDQSCKSTDFSFDGRTLYTISAKAAVFIDTRSMQMCNYCAFELSNDLTTVCSINDWSFCTGDEKGNVMVWDSRDIRPLKSVQYKLKGSDDTNEYIADMIVTQNSNLIATASGAGVITVFDLRKLEPITQNFDSKSDLTSLCSIRNDEYIIAGSLKGELIFTGWSDSTSNRSHTFEVIHNEACNDIVNVDDNLIITSWDDNFIRVHSVFPHQSQGCIAELSLPSEHIAISEDKKVIGSIGIEKRLYIWDIRNLKKEIKKFTKQNDTKKDFHLEKKNFFSDL